MALKQNWLPFEEARAIVAAQGFKKYAEFTKWKGRPPNIPSNPREVYGLGFSGREYWIGIVDVPNVRAPKFGVKFLPYSEARMIAQELMRQHGVTDQTGWFSFVKGLDKPDNIPGDPSAAYENKGWEGWPHWFGRPAARASGHEVVRSFTDARTYARTLGLERSKDWYVFWKTEERPIDIPFSPETRYRDEGWFGWPDFLGSRSSKLTHHGIVKFLRSLVPCIEYLTEVDLYLILMHNGMLRRDQRLLGTGILRGLMHARSAADLQNAEDEIIAELQKSDVTSVDENIFESIVPQKPPLASTPPQRSFDVFEAVKNVDRIVEQEVTDDDGENQALSFMVDERIEMLWQEAATIGEQSVLRKLRELPTGKYVQVIREQFEEELTTISALQIPDGYRMVDAREQTVSLNLMQRLTAYRLMSRKRIGNWSGVGTGKTNAAIFAAAYVDAKMTLILVANSTRAGWTKTLTRAFDKDTIHVHDGEPLEFRFRKNRRNFVVVNYEKFQREWTGRFVDLLFQQAVLDFVVFDEVQHVRQRYTGESRISERRRQVNELIQRGVEQNPDLRILAMSATPVVNNLTEAVNLLRLIRPESDFSSVPVGATIANAIGVHQLLKRHGLRFARRNDLILDEYIEKIDGSAQLEVLRRLRPKHLLLMEKTLLLAKLRHLSRWVRRGTLIYTQFVTGIVEPLTTLVADLGLRARLFTGEERTVVEEFVKEFEAGTADVLIGSSPVGTGVDGLQFVLDRIIFITLPWSHAEYEQIVGRLCRQGSAFKKIEVIIPQVVLNHGDGNRWSWDEQRLHCIKFKESLSDAALDGVIPSDGLPSIVERHRRSLEALQKWIERSCDAEPSTEISQNSGKNPSSIVAPEAFPETQPTREIKFPLRHLSVRVPWHDSGWNGAVCKSPSSNTSCLKLGRIAAKKNAPEEELVRGKSVVELQAIGTPLPPCVTEGATFMAGFPFEIIKPNQYAGRCPGTHGHLLPIKCQFPAYSVGVTPLRWFMRRNVFGNTDRSGLVNRFPLSDVREELERPFRYGEKYIQDFQNQSKLFECFWNHVRPKESLVFYYAMPIPLVEEQHQRAIVGVGRILDMGPMMQFGQGGTDRDALRAILWERIVSHSIRPDVSDGFLLPYHEALEQSEDGCKFDPSEAVAFVPDDHVSEFGHGAEHVGNDGAISALRSIRDALTRCSNLFGYDARRQHLWIDKEIGRLWQRRGPWPGLGSVLCASGVTLGNFMAEYLVKSDGTYRDPWPIWHEALRNPENFLPSPLAGSVSPEVGGWWMKLNPVRRSYLELLSRMSLTEEQATFLLKTEDRKKRGISYSEEQILENPYVIYEATRLSQDAISLDIVDRGVFPVNEIREQFPIPEPSHIKTCIDPRRLRAFTIQNLELAAGNGHTLQPRADVIQAIHHRHLDQGDSIQAHNRAFKDAETQIFAKEIKVVTMADNSVAYQLQRLAAAGEIISRSVEERIREDRYSAGVDWRQHLDKFLAAQNVSLPNSQLARENEERARVEKAAALSELASSRISVLIGRAGTGKTTVLSVLCNEPSISEDGILLLAPTGKARIAMEKVAREAGGGKIQSKTLAGYLKSVYRFDAEELRYLLLGEAGRLMIGTVIIDECSMLTEEMLAAVLESFEKVERLILVGDYRQLPPIGAGRPFFDIVARLKPDSFEEATPSISRGFAELTIPMRQGAVDRDDLILASWFDGTSPNSDDDRVYQILSGDKVSDTLQFRTWETPSDLQALLPEVLRESLGFSSDVQDWQAFCKSLGGQSDHKGSYWFKPEHDSHPGARKFANSWQILSPVRRNPWGVDALNQFVHDFFKTRQIAQAREIGKKRTIPSPMGSEAIVYGEKVIYVISHWRVPGGRVHPPQNEPVFLVNGEVGIVVGRRSANSVDPIPDELQVEFSTQPGRTITFYHSDFLKEPEPPLQLAYALTVHKSQGSEFETVILVLPRSSLMVTREMLYTALTRQKKKVVILLQGTATDLHQLQSAQNSATARRMTNLFSRAYSIPASGTFLPESRIHRTTRGELVRSKSEVIVANLLHARQIKYEYEQQLEIGGIPTSKFPDFTIEDRNAGVTYYWEHLGMLNDAQYARRWEEKKKWYQSRDIVLWDAPDRSPLRLIVSKDGTRGEIDSEAIAALIDVIFRDATTA